MSRKHKKSGKIPLSRRPMPKLGWQDHLLYGFGTLLPAGLGLGLGSVMLPPLLKNPIAFQNPQTVACQGAGSGWGVIPLCWFLFLGLLLAAGCWQRRRPILGRAGVSYGPPEHPAIYPLIWRDKPSGGSSRKNQALRRRANRILAGVLAGISLVSLALGALAYCGRETLEQEGTVAVYNALNRETECRTPEDLTTARAETCHRYNRYGRTGGNRVFCSVVYSLELCLEYTDGSTYRFDLGEFRGSDLEKIQTLLHLKEQYGHLFQVGDATYLRDVAVDRDLTPEEETLLYRLFDREQP